VRALVTGATGFVGAAVARALLRDGWQVRTLARAGSDHRNLKDLDVELAIGDLKQPATLVAAAAKCDAVFHVAADYRLGTREPRELYENNVDGTRNVLHAAARAGVPLLRGNSQAIGPLFIPGQTSCPACEWRRAKEEIPGAREIVEYYRSERRGRGYGAALSTTIAWSSTLLAHEALVFLSGLPPPRTRNAKVSVSLDDPLSAKVTPCPVDPGCEACGPR